MVDLIKQSEEKIWVVARIVNQAIITVEETKLGLVDFGIVFKPTNDLELSELIKLCGAWY
jgi:hypothetical protein